MADLNALYDQLTAAEGPAAPLSIAVLVAFGRDPAAAPALVATWADPVASVDAALDLVERALPGWSCSVTKGEDLRPLYPGAWCSAKVQGPQLGEFQFAQAPTAPLAILRALVAALMARAPATEEFIRNG